MKQFLNVKLYHWNEKLEKIILRAVARVWRLPLRTAAEIRSKSLKCILCTSL